MSKITDLTAQLARPVVEENGCTLWDVEYVKEADPIQDAYTFEVSSAGADRALKKPEHFAAFLGEQVDAKFYQSVNGQKAVTGTLVGYDNGDVTLDLGDGPVTFAKKDVAQVRLHVGF